MKFYQLSNPKILNSRRTSKVSKDGRGLGVSGVVMDYKYFRISNLKRDECQQNAFVLKSF